MSSLDWNEMLLVLGQECTVKASERWEKALLNARASSCPEGVFTGEGQGALAPQAPATWCAIQEAGPALWADSGRQECE